MTVSTLSRESNRLTGAELEILKLIAGGLQNKEIALRRGTTVNTVKAQIFVIYRKLDAKNRVQALNVARARGMLG